MTLIKSLLLGSAAGIVAIASAQAADLPTRKGAPAAEYVRVCTINVGGTPIVGWTLPGSDTCLKISGYLSAQIAGGNLNNQYAFAPAVPAGFAVNQTTGVITATPATAAGATNLGTRPRPDIGYFTRGQVNFDAVSNTGAGPLLAHIELQGNHGTGFDSVASGVVINSAYLTWAGLTAGKHGSFFDYLAGGDTWKDFYSPDHSGTPVNLLAYTVAFGGGASVTGSAEENETVAQNNDFNNGAGTSANGSKAPDFVLSLDVAQPWGGAHLAGVAHDADITQVGVGSDNVWGYGIIGGLTFNIPNLAGDKLALQGAWTKGAVGYSGATSPGYDEGDNGQNINGNGYIVTYSDVLYTGAGWTQPVAWTAAAQLTLKVSPSFEIDPEVSYGSYNVNSAYHAEGWWVGAVWDWTPAKNIDFALDTIYMNTHITAPVVAAGFAPSTSDGFNVRLRITRSF